MFSKHYLNFFRIFFFENYPLKSIVVCHSRTSSPRARARAWRRAFLALVSARAEWRLVRRSRRPLVTCRAAIACSNWPMGRRAALRRRWRSCATTERWAPSGRRRGRRGWSRSTPISTRCPPSNSPESATPVSPPSKSGPLRNCIYFFTLLFYVFTFSLPLSFLFTATNTQTLHQKNFVSFAPAFNNNCCICNASPSFWRRVRNYWLA